MTLAEVMAEIDRLQAIKRELESIDQVEYDKRCKKFVGRCYKYDNGRIFKILAIPRKYLDVDFHSRYNKYNFPVLVLNTASFPLPCDYFDDFVPCYCDEVFFDIDKYKMPYNTIEITSEEFDTEFDKCIAHFKELVGKCEPKSKQPMSRAEFIDRYCGPCGTQRCGGPDDELYSEGCQYFKDWREGRI